MGIGYNIVLVGSVDKIECKRVEYFCIIIVDSNKVQWQLNAERLRMVLIIFLLFWYVLYHIDS